MHELVLSPATRMSYPLIPSSEAAADAVQRFQIVLDDFTNDLGNLAAIAAIDVHEQGRLYLTSGFADLEKTETATSGHVFQIGSQSKTALAVVMLRLQGEGRLRLDDRVIAYLDLPIDKRITLRHLVMNQSGLGEATFAMLGKRRDPRIRYAPRDLVALALPQGQLFEPGSRFDYCNTGWVIAAMIIEKVCGVPCSAVIRRMVVEPLGLGDTTFGDERRTSKMLRGYVESDATDGLIDASDCLSWVYGAGDGVSSLDDMLSFYGALRHLDNPLGIGLDCLTAETGRPVADPYFSLSIGTEYGLGLERRRWAGSEVWGHPGSTSSYMSATWLDVARGVTVVTCVTRAVAYPLTIDAEHRYPRAQLFAMALNTAYALASDRKGS
jgi:D-alanyl-D-alanine carboxypeptidase